jgi:AcrR family transcriptional regulator
MSVSKKPARGRPRDEQARRAILDAAYSLVQERGYARVTTADIAVRAGAGKQTIYRWWPSKGALVLDAVEDWMERWSDPEPKKSFSAALVEMCRGASQAGPVLCALMAEAQFDADLHARLRKQVIEPRGAMLRACLSDRRQSERDLIVSMISGLVWQALLLGEPLDARFLRRMMRMVNRLV